MTENESLLGFTPTFSPTGGDTNNTKVDTNNTKSNTTNTKPVDPTSNTEQPFSLSNVWKTSKLIDDVEGGYFDSSLSELEGVYGADSNYQVRQDANLKQLEKHWQQEVLDLNPTSEKQTQAIVSNLLKRQEAEKQIAKQGIMTQVAAAFLADLNSKEDLAVTGGLTALTLGLGTFAKGLWTAGRTARRIRNLNRLQRTAKGAATGLAVGAAEGTLEAGVKLAGNDLYDLSDSLQDIMFSSATGGVLGGIGGSLSKSADKLEVRGKTSRASTNREAASLANEAEDILSSLFVRAVEDTDAVEGGWKALKVRFDLGARGQKIESAIAKDAYGALLTDAVDVDGKADGADYIAMALRDNVGLTFKDELAEAFKLDNSILKRGEESKAAFLDRVYRKVATGQAGSTEAEQRAIDATKRALEELRVRASNAGVEGADFDALDNYVPRIWKGDGVKQRIRNGELTIDSVKSALRNAVRSSQPTIADTEVESLVERIVIGGDLDPYAKETVSSVSLRDGFLADEDRYKKRIDLDMSAVSDDGQVALFDLVDTNLNNILDNYTASASGRIALAEKGIQDTDSLLELILNEIKQNHKGSDKELAKKLEEAREVHSDTVNGIMGRQQRDRWSQGGLNKALNSGLLKFLKTSMNFSMLDYASAAAIPEIAVAVGRLGLSGVLKNMPVVRKLTQPQLKAVMNELEAIGLHLGNSSNARYFGKAVSDLEAGGKLDAALNTADRAAFKLNLLSYVEGGVNKLLTLQTVNKIAKKGKLTKAMRRDMGLSAEEAEYLSRHLGKIETNKGFTGSSIKSFNFESWLDANGQPDKRAMDLLARGAKRAANRANAKMAVGEKITGLDNPFASVMYQFMNTVANSYQRVLLRTGYEVFGKGAGIDAGVRLAAVLGTLLSGLVAYYSWYGKESFRAVGDRKKDRELDRMTTGEKVLKGAAYTPLMGAPLAAMEKLSPVLYMMGIEVNDFARYQKASGIISGAPILSQVDTVSRSLAAVAGDDRMTEKEKQAALKLLPLYEVGDNLKRVAEDVL